MTGGIATAFGALVIGGGSISAAHTDAASFAADCNANGTVAIAGALRVVGGTGVLTTNCIITLDAGEKLVFRGVDLTGPALVVTTSNPSGADTTVKVIDSSIEMSGPLQLSPGAVAGDTEAPDSDATVVVRRSAVSGASVAITTGTAGVCRTSGNIPALICS